MGEKVMGAGCVCKCGLERGLGLGEGGGGEAIRGTKGHVKARIVGWGGRVDYVRVWTRTCGYLTIGWMVGGSFAIMFDDDMF